MNDSQIPYTRIRFMVMSEASYYLRPPFVLVDALASTITDSQYHHIQVDSLHHRLRIAELHSRVCTAHVTVPADSGCQRSQRDCASSDSRSRHPSCNQKPTAAGTLAVASTGRATFVL